MSADFWAGYISGAAGIIIGNPLDLIKVRLQAGTSRITPSSYTSQFPTTGSLVRGATAPILGYGALNALLFMTYNRTTLILSGSAPGSSPPPSLWTTWLAGAVGGLATWVVSTPTELVKCRAQVFSHNSPLSPTSTPVTSLGIARHILRTEGIRGLYFGGVITALRDSIGYGFYFWSYELCTRSFAPNPSSPSVSSSLPPSSSTSIGTETGTSTSTAAEAARIFLCGGIAGVITWASIFPLDVIKTRVQTQLLAQSPGPSGSAETTPLLESSPRADQGTRPIPRTGQRINAFEMARLTYQNEGLAVFFRGLGVCSVRAFIVNAAQWAVYESIMKALQPQERGKIVI